MSGVTWGSGAKYSGVMYRSPPSPLVMIAGEVVAAVSSTVMSLQHVTCHVSHTLVTTELSVCSARREEGD